MKSTYSELRYRLVDMPKDKDGNVIVPASIWNLMIEAVDLIYKQVMED